MNSAEFRLDYLLESELLQKLLVRVSRIKKGAYLRYISLFPDWASDGLEKLSIRALNSPSWRRELFKINEVYSHDLTLKRVVGLPLDHSLELIIEHGLILFKTVIENSSFHERASRNIVMSEPRASFLRQEGIMATEIGPYVHYANPIFERGALHKLKAEFGKTLLFFPSHSTKEVSTEDTYNDAFKVIEELKVTHGFDTVLVCGHFMDIQQGLFSSGPKHKHYRYVSAGYNRCPFFLDMLKTFIELSDVVASNSMGTQAGYALYMGKPYWVVSDRSVHKHYSGRVIEIEKQNKRMRTPLIGKSDLYFEDVENLFRNQNFDIDSCVYDTCSDLWGYDHIKQPLELRAILLNND